MRASDPHAPERSQLKLNSRENDEKSFWKNSKGKTHKSAKEKKSCGDLQRTKYPVNRARSKKHGRCHEFARVGFIFKFLPPAFIEQIYSPFSFFFGLCFLRNFVQGVFSHNVRFHGFYIRKFIDTNGLNDAESNNATRHSTTLNVNKCV